MRRDREKNFEKRRLIHGAKVNQPVGVEAYSRIPLRSKDLRGCLVAFAFSKARTLSNILKAVCQLASSTKMFSPFFLPLSVSRRTLYAFVYTAPRCFHRRKLSAIPAAVSFLSQRNGRRTTFEKLARIYTRPLTFS